MNLNRNLLWIAGFLSAILLHSCQNSSKETSTLTRDSLIAHAPVLSPEEFLKFTHTEDGFELQLVASEPQITTPVSMIFDTQNRIWVVEMTDYMPDMEGDGEDKPSGKVVILEDKDGDGVYESRKIFLDSLVLPRSIAFADDGLLVVEPPRLWYYKIKDDKPYDKTLVDSAFNEGDNVESLTNGLYRDLDNWFYDAGNSSNKRYKKVGDKWVIGRTQMRGQWGISQDDEGRLYYNNNSQNLLGDYFLPGLGNNNPNLNRVDGFNKNIVPDNRTYPSRPNRGVNRGYLPTEVSDSTGKLLKFTAACGPLIYRGELFPEAYYQNAFVAEPAGNLIKRDLLQFEPNKTIGKQAYEDREFITSDDERFRPVNLYNGPDGALYIVDMYRGVIQHKLFLTKYLKEEIQERNLEQPINCGRIYRVVPKGFKPRKNDISTAPLKLLSLFKNKNSWERETAQRILVDTKPQEAIEPLKKMLGNPANYFEFVHSLWTLKGMNALSNDEIANLIQKEKEDNRLIQLYTALSDSSSFSDTQSFVARSEDLISDSIVAPYIAFRTDVFKSLKDDALKRIRKELVAAYPHSAVIGDAIISNAYKEEKTLYKNLKSEKGIPQDARIFKKLEAIIQKIDHPEDLSKETLLRRKYGRGIGLFKTTCQACHGSNGAGIPHLAPPLSGSQWVQGDKERLISIVLYGLTGPVTVAGKRYESSDVSGEMPAAKDNPQMVDADLALLLSYIRKNWKNNASEVSLDDIKKVKKRWGDRDKPFTIEEIMEIK